MVTRENLMTTLDQYNTAIYLKDLRGQYMSMNTTGLNFMRESHTRVLGKTAHDLFDLTTAAQMTETDRVAIENKNVYTSAFDARDKKSGHKLPMFTAKSAILSPSGQPLGIVGLSLVGYKDAHLFAEACRILPKFFQRKQYRLLTELLELRTVSEFLKLYTLH